jgi:uncharacterized protein
MYKLTSRRKRYLFVLALAIFGALVVVLPSHNPDKTWTLSFFVLILIELVLSGLFAVLFYPKANPIQLVQIGLTISSFVVFLGGIGSIGSGVTRALPGGDIVISWVQLAIMNLGGVVSTLALWTLAVTKTVLEAPSETEVNSNEVVARLKTESARSRDKMPAFGDEDLAQNSAVRSSQSGIPSANPSASQSGMPAQRGSNSGQGMPAATASTTRLTSQGKKGSSTFTKLQALSASGTGSLQNSPGESLISEPDGLKSILDRLDTPGAPANEAPAAPAAKILDVPPASPPVRPTAPESKPSASLPGADKAPPKSSISSRLVGVVTGNRIPSVEPPEKIIEPPFQSAVSNLELDSIPTPAAEAEKAVVKEFSIADLESIPTPKVAESKEAEGEPDLSKFDLDSIPTPKVDAKAEVTHEPVEARAEPEAKPEVKTGGISSTFAAKANAIKSKFVGAGGPEAKRSSTSLDAMKTDIANKKEEALNPTVKADAPPKEPVTEVVAEVAPEPQEEAASNLFGKGVDNDLDDIFSGLAPAEAQREFDPSLVNKEEPPVVSEGEEAPATGIFGVKVDNEVDDIFSTLAPAESLKEFKKPEPEPEHESEPVSAPVAKAERDGIFDESVNDELDDIFSNLAPAEAQMTVKDKERIAAQEESAEAMSEALPEAESEPESFAPEVAETAVVAQEESFAPQPQQPEESFEPVEAPQSESEGMMINPVTKNKEVKEFGRLSSRAANVTGQAPPTVGTMKTIGKLLLDVQAIENIIKSGEEGTIGAGLTNARVITAQRGEGIKALLAKIDSYDGVIGSLIVGHDGLVIAATVGTGMDKDILGALSTALLSTSNLATLKLDIGKLRQMVLLTEHGANGTSAKPVTTVLTDVEVGILAVFLDTQNLEQVDGLLVAIHETIHG